MLEAYTSINGEQGDGLPLLLHNVPVRDPGDTRCVNFCEI
jgi:hypothetical protein